MIDQQVRPASPQSFADLAEPVSINRTLLALTATLATVLGLAPWVAFVQKPLLLVLIAVAALGISIFATRDLTTRVGEAPGALDFALGLVGAVSTMAAATLAGVMVYIAAWSVWWLLRFAASSLLDSEIGRTPESIAFWCSAFFIALIGAVNVSDTVQTLAKQLYPATAGTHSAFYSLVHFKRGRTLLRLGLTLTGVVAVTAVAFLYPGPRLWLCPLLAWAFVLVGVEYQKLGSEEEAPVATGNTIEAVRALFSAAGYDAVVSPRTGRADLDPLLVDAPDIYAERGSRALAIQVRSPDRQTSEDDDWTSLSDLSSAAWVLADFVNTGREEDLVEVLPMTVLVGVDTPVPVQVYRLKDLLEVLEIDAKALDDFTKIEDEAERAELAAKYLEAEDRVVPVEGSR